MENLSLVAAIGKQNELGLNNNLIWKIKEDLQFYRKLTLHQNIIMGRKTFESMPPKALEKRNIFILSSQNIEQCADVNVFNNFELLLEYIEMTRQNFIVVGGAHTYEQFLPYVDIMYLTEIYSTSKADTYFPHIDVNEWNIETIYSHQKDNLNTNVDYIRNKYIRKRRK